MVKQDHKPMVAQHFSVVGAQLPANHFGQKDSTPQRMRDLAQEFVNRFKDAVESKNAQKFNDLFIEEGYWRDIIAFTNDYRTLTKINILQAARDTLDEAGAYGGEIDMEPKFHTLDEYAFIEFGFRFNTALGPCMSTVRLVKTIDGRTGAQLLYTSLEGIHGHLEITKKNRIHGDKNSPIPYDKLRNSEIENPEPTVIIIGGGQCGVTVAARLKYLGIKSLVIDRFERIGDNWRKRYGSLALHDALYSQEFPYMKWPDTFPEFIPAGKLGNWFEHYVESLELNVWVKSSIVTEKTRFDESKKMWHVTIDRDGKEYQFTVSHLVMCTGLNGGKAKWPTSFPGQNKFKNPIIHSSTHKGGAGWKGKNVVVMGTGSSGHDIALDLYNHGANATMLQRSPTFVMSIANGNIKTFSADLWVDGVDVDYADRITEALPKALAKSVHQKLIARVGELDKDMITGLKKAGFQWYSGPEGSGYMFLSMEHCGGFYFDSGCSGRIINGDIKMQPGSIDHFTEDEIVLKDGTKLSPDLVIFATGYTGFKESVKETLGEKYSQKLKKIWGLDSEGELHGLYRECGIPNCYYVVGAIPQARVHSKYVALQILAEKLGKLGERYTIEKQQRTGNYVNLASSLYQ